MEWMVSGTQLARDECPLKPTSRFHVDRHPDGAWEGELNWTTASRRQEVVVLWFPSEETGLEAG
jgi:hypothetical protein